MCMGTPPALTGSSAVVIGEQRVRTLLYCGVGAGADCAGAGRSGRETDNTPTAWPKLLISPAIGSTPRRRLVIDRTALGRIKPRLGPGPLPSPCLAHCAHALRARVLRQPPNHPVLSHFFDPPSTCTRTCSRLSRFSSSPASPCPSLLRYSSVSLLVLLMCKGK
jgi:hypothetical protein